MTISRLHLAAAAILLSVLVAARAARAADDSAKAEQLIQEANELRRQGRDQRALPLLQQAYDLARTARTAAQLGLAEMALGYWVEAEAHLNEALTATRHPWVDKNRDTLTQALATARSHLAEVTVDGTPEGAEVLLNGKRVGTLPLAAPVKAIEGPADFEARAPGYRSDRRSLSLAGGAKEHVTLQLVAEATPPGGAGVAGPLPGGGGGGGIAVSQLPTWRRVLPWSVAGGAGLALIFGIWQHASWRSSQSDFEAIAACGAAAPMRGADPRCQGLYDDLSSAKTRAVIGYSIAGALGAGAVALFVWNRSAAHPGETSSGTMAVGPGPGQIGFSYALAF
jgi:hypothetical protein